MNKTKILMIYSTLVAAILLAFGTGLRAKPISYELPEEKSALKQTPGVDVVENNCASCHSVDYIVTQPRGLKFKNDFWKSEVDKMIKVYGAPVDAADIPKIVDYLAKTY